MSREAVTTDSETPYIFAHESVGIRNVFRRTYRCQLPSSSSATSRRPLCRDCQDASRRAQRRYHGYVGSVGTGFKDKEARDLKTSLVAIRTKGPTVTVKGKPLVFVEPVLAAEIECRAWTGDGKLRHGSYKGLRYVENSVAIYVLEDKLNYKPTSCTAVIGALNVAVKPVSK